LLGLPQGLAGFPAHPALPADRQGQTPALATGSPITSASSKSPPKLVPVSDVNVFLLLPRASAQEPLRTKLKVVRLSTELQWLSALGRGCPPVYSQGIHSHDRPFGIKSLFFRTDGAASWRISEGPLHIWDGGGLARPASRGVTGFPACPAFADRPQGPDSRASNRFPDYSRVSEVALGVVPVSGVKLFLLLCRARRKSPAAIY
jgi:hypothetical protein